MICDVHIHVGYYNRLGFDRPFYYSPRRVCSVLRRCGVDEFVFSSTSMQTRGVDYRGVHKEAEEVVRIFGKRAHPFLWVTKGYLDYDPSLSVLSEGLYQGIKLHGRETPWITKYMKELKTVLDRAQALRLPVIVHTDAMPDSRPLNWLCVAAWYKDMRFDFAHGCPREEMVQCLEAAKNIFCDTAGMANEDLAYWASSPYRNRILPGSDFPTVQAKNGEGLTVGLRRVVRSVSKCDQLQKGLLVDNFVRFLGG